MKTNSAAAFFFAVIACTLAGCVTHQFPATPLEPLSDQAKAARIPVFVSGETRTREDRCGFGRQFAFKSGAVFAEVFNGTDPSVARLEIGDTSEEDHITDLGFTGTYLYRMNAVLVVSERNYPLKAEGFVRAHGTSSPTVYAQLACERACADLAKQIRQHL